MSGVHGLPPQYDLVRFPFMAPVGPHMPVRLPLTEGYVSVPPALQIRDDEGGVWTLGFDYDEREWRGGKWEYDIVRNGRVTGEFGRVIEFRRRKVRIWGAEGWRTFNGRQFV